MAQSAKAVVQIVSITVLARLLRPSDFGLVAMVTGITGVVGLIKDAGLSTATVQSSEITQDQISTLFWINVGLSLFLMMVVVAIAPLIGSFYDEPRLAWIARALSISFLFSGLTVQHQALLRRQLRFGTLAAVEILAQAAGVTVGILMASWGLAYWALVGITAAAAFANAVGVWVAVRWFPGWPVFTSGVGSMIRFGGNLAGVNVLNYLSRNADKVLLGWCWGSTALGLYSRTFQLLLLPVSQLNTPLGTVAVSAMSRLQDNPARFRRYFLASYTVVTSLTLPIVAGATLFADDFIRILLGPGWEACVPILKWLAPGAMASAMLAPLGWLLVSLGRSGRFLKITCWVNAATVLACCVGVIFGPSAVAASYSISLGVLLIPLSLTMIRGTGVRGVDLLQTVAIPLLAGACATLLAATVPILVTALLGKIGSALAGFICFLSAYIVVLLYLGRQTSVQKAILLEAKNWWRATKISGLPTERAS